MKTVNKLKTQEQEVNTNGVFHSTWFVNYRDDVTSLAKQNKDKGWTTSVEHTDTVSTVKFTMIINKDIVTTIVRGYKSKNSTVMIKVTSETSHDVVID